MVSAETLAGAGSGPEGAFDLSPGICSAFRSRAYAIAERRLRVRLDEGFDTVLLLGEAGTGKTTLLSSLAAELAWTYSVIHLVRPPFDASEAFARWRDVEAAIGESRHIVAIVDDADLVPIELQVAAHEARQIEGGPRIQFVFGVKPPAYGRLSGVAGELDEAMSSCTLGRLDDDEVPEFVGHRLTTAGVSRDHFTREALAHVALCAQGVPRLVNLICAKACFLAGMNNEARISAASVEEAAFVLRLGNISVGRLSEDSATALSAA